MDDKPDSPAPTRPSLADWLGLRGDVVREETRWLGRTLGFLIIVLGLLAAGLAAVLLVLLVVAALSVDDGADVRNVGLVLAALLGAPFVAWRSWVADKQARIAAQQKEHNELVLLNGRIQGALALLGARVKITRIGRNLFHDAPQGREGLLQWHLDTPDIPGRLANAKAGDWTVFDLEEDDVQTRLSGIGQLQAIVAEAPDQRRAIAGHLANYIRANAPADRAQDHGLADVGAAEEDAHRTTPRKRRQAIRAWAAGLVPRPDIQAAIALTGAASAPDANARLDLRRTSLQGAELPGANLARANLQEARLEGARLDGANLGWARMEGANLGWARMEGAKLGWARMEGANLRAARLEGAKLVRARLQGADLRAARLEGANLRAALLQGADLRAVRFDAETNFTAAVCQYAAVKSSDLSKSNVTQDQVNAMFGDGSVGLPDGLARPGHWPEKVLDPKEFHQRWNEWTASARDGFRAQGE